MAERKNDNLVDCPVCSRYFESSKIEDHVNKCLFLHTQSISKRKSTDIEIDLSIEKKIKLSPGCDKPTKSTIKNENKKSESAAVPLAEKMRPAYMDELVGQNEAFGPGSMLRSLLERKQIPNMILWGPPGCGKTSLANVIATMCKDQHDVRFVKLSATMSGINDVKEVIKIAKNEAQFKRRTVLFMDEIHRFNKLQQDTFLPHVESGTIVLIGATTENPSFSLNNALLSRCRVVVMDKLTPDHVHMILERSLKTNEYISVVDTKEKLNINCRDTQMPNKCRLIVEQASLRWLSEICDGDARIALGALELALKARTPCASEDMRFSEPATLTLQDVQEGIKRSHILYDQGGDEHYNIVSALHKSIRAGDDNAALYWCTRAIVAGEDPRFVARRLVRAAAEDIGLADPSALVEAVACHQGCQLIGMPESDVLLAQCAVRLARAPKSTEVYHAMKRCKQAIEETKGPLPSVPLHLRNACTKLMKQLGHGRGYNTLPCGESGLNYMPEGMENINFFDS